MKRIAAHRNRLSALSLLLCLALSLFLAVRSYADEPAPRVLFLGVDAIPYRIFVEAQEQGLFKDFKRPSRMISVFPSLSNYAWATLMNTEKLESYQAKYYHWGFNRVVGRLFHEVGKPPFPNRFDYSDDSVLKKVLAYITGGSSTKKEMKKLSKRVLASNEPRIFYYFCAASDIVAHMRGAKGLHKMLRIIDREVTVMRQKHLEKFNEPLVVIFVSDHGNTLVSGKIIDLDDVIKKNNFRLTNSLEGPDDVVCRNSGILSVASFFIQEPRKIELAYALSTQPWADVVVTRDNKRGLFLVISQKGTLSYEYNEESEEFRIAEVTGEDPLGLIEQGLPLGEWIPQSEVLEASVKTLYPDSLMRIQRGLTDRGVCHPAAVNVSLKLGCESGSKFMKFLAKFRGRSGTHGSLSAYDSIGVMASTDHVYPEWVPIYEVHKLIEGYDFEKRFAAMTLIWGEGGKCIARFGQPLLDAPGIARIQFTLRTYDHQKGQFSKSYDLYKVKIRPGANPSSLNGQARFYDVSLPKTLVPKVVYEIETRALDAKNRVVARLKIERFHIMPYKGYKTIPIQKIYQ